MIRTEALKLSLVPLLIALLPGAFVFRFSQTEWVVNDRYRMAVSVDPGRGNRFHTPVGVDVNFAEVFNTHGIKGRLDRNSIRVVRYDPGTGRALPYQAGSSSYEVPYQLSHDFYYQDSGKIWWRIQDQQDGHFHIYFDTVENGPKEAPQAVALIGCGDNFLFNNGQPGPLDVGMSASVRYIDWDGDGKKDLLVGSSQTHEYGVPTDHGYIYFFKNIGTAQSPLFASGYQLRNEAGAYVQTFSGVYMYFDVVDWDGDGDLDLIVADGPKLYLFENTGKRDRNNLPILKPYKQIVQLIHGNDFTDDYHYKFPHLVDWDGDGDLDVLY
ncbi:MAG TPA: FG-GAP-like repeat-containing protein, partial [Acidobacteriota bacterium]